MTEYLDTWMIDRKKFGRLSLWNEIRRRFLPPERTLVSGLDPLKLARYIDVSHYNGEVDIAIVKKKFGISAVMAKCSDGKQTIPGAVNDLNTYTDQKFSYYVQAAADNDLPLIAYPYFQPDVWHDNKEYNRQYQAMLYALKNKRIHKIRLDVEQKSVLHHTEITRRVMQFYDWARVDFPQIAPPDFYTSVGYLSSVSSLTDSLMSGDKKYVHYAQWVGSTKYRTTWENILNNVMPKLDMRVMNYNGWNDLQWTCQYYGMEGVGDHEIDLNLHCGTEASLWKYLNFTPSQPGPDPEPEPEPGDLAALTARVAELERWRKS